jgi:DNA-binding transcriptional MerR regulator
MENALPEIPEKRYFTIGEVSELCGVKPYVLRYWEQEFSQLKPTKRRGNRRYYQHHEVLLIRRIRDLLYDQGFTISGARNRLLEHPMREVAVAAGLNDTKHSNSFEEPAIALALNLGGTSTLSIPAPAPSVNGELTAEQMRDELLSIRSLLGS